MDILSSGDLANLTNREADVAIRVVYDRKTLPQNLHGLKGPELFGSVYIARDRLAAWRAGHARSHPVDRHQHPRHSRLGPARAKFPPPEFPSGPRDAEAQIAAVKQGLGITALPCFMADADPLLVRVPGAPLHKYGAVWLLTHGETRKTKRVQLFTAFLSRRLAAYAPRLAGLHG